MPSRAASSRAGRTIARPPSAGGVRHRSPVCGRAVVSLIALGLACASAALAAQSLASMPERRARHAQRDFEYLRRALLPRVPPHTGGCDVTIGDMCYWDDNDGPPLPPERPRVAFARHRLRASLDSLGTLDSANDYIAGQRVRYALDGGDAPGARAAADGCTATPWWCSALRGLARHRAGDEAASAEAFDSALAEMPDTLRCAWLDVRAWAPPGTRLDADHDANDCASRAAGAARVFWLSAPLLTWRRNAARDEFFSRLTWSALLAGTVNPQASSWRWDAKELALRMGWPDQWAREDPPVGAAAFPDARVVGNEPRPSFSVVPERHALEFPFSAKPADWRLTGDRTARVRYAPGWLRSIDTLPVQIARFRGPHDSMIVVAAFDGRTLLDSGSTAVVAAASLSAGLEAESTLALGLTTTAPVGAIVLQAAARPSLGAVEVFDSVGRRAARWRAGLAPLADSDPISDLLIGTDPAAFAPRSPDEAARTALARLRFTPHDTLALYWESYLRPPPGVRPRITVRLTRAAGLFGRIGRAIGVSHAQTGPGIAWEDQLPDSIPARSIRFSLGGVPPGRYRLEVIVETPAARGTAARTIEVVD